MEIIKKHQTLFIKHLDRFVKERNPENLYAPVNYILGLGGKRLRPILTLLTAEVFQARPSEALDAALAIEVFHNFSLIHDDIMDQAPIRRGKETVHVKWDVNTGILSGDAMLIMAYKLFENYDDSIFKQLTQLFSKTALEVCEGQQLDIDFESYLHVEESKYIQMIEYKTAVLVAAAMQMGAIIARATPEAQEQCYQFGKHLGIAFQLQDDYLDAFGDPQTFGKQVGGDIIENKKTFLYIKALEFATPAQKNRLELLYSEQQLEDTKKIEEVLHIFKVTKADEAIKTAIQQYTDMAFDFLGMLDIPSDKKAVLHQFGTNLMTRSV